MIAELAAANAAFAVIKAAINNGGEILAAGQKIFDYFDAKASIQKRLNEKAKPGHDHSEMEEFMALEQLKAQEEHLRQSMIYAGRPGLWDDWVKYQAQAARRRREVAEAAKLAQAKREKEMQDFAVYSLVAASVIGAIFLIIFIVMH
jgi:hypothetical protein